MKTKIKQFSSGLFVFLMASMAGLSAHADDTEIFFSTLVSSEVQPNIVFILDNSISMDGTKMTNMKAAMNTLLTNMNNVNVGIMQFSYPGAAVVYPVTDIDAYTPEPVPYTYAITTGSNDVEEANSTVTSDNVRLATTERSSSGNNVISTEVTASADDAEELIADGTINVLNSVSLELPIDDLDTDPNLEHAVGTIFRGVAIPDDAVIVSAKIEFAVHQDSNNTDELNLEIAGQLTGAATVEAFSDSANVTGRTSTTNKVNWNISGPAAVGDIESTPNLVKIIQEIVDQSDWNSGDDIALMMQRKDTSTGARVYASFDNSSSLPVPKLVITYEDLATTKTQIVGLRYENVNVPQGALITSAILQVNSASEHDNAVTYNIYADSAPDSLVANDSDTLSGRGTTANTITWTPGAWETDQEYSTPELRSIVQEIVNNGSWCGGDALTLMLSNGGDTRFISAYEDSPDKAPKLTITYDAANIATGGGCLAGETSVQIAGNNDDGQGVTSGGTSNDLDENYIPLGRDANKNRIGGFRFDDIQLPQGAIVQNAYIEFVAYEDGSSDTDLTIKVQNSSDASALTTNNQFKDKNYLSAEVVWNNVTPWTSGSAYRTPDLTSLVQPIANKTNWAAGNAMFFALRGSGLRKAVSRDYNTLNAARLVISYQNNAASGASTSTRNILKGVVDGLQAKTWTPIVDSLYEAALYYRGDAVKWGTKRYHTSSYNNARYLRVSHPDSYTGGTEYWPSGCTDSDLNDSDCSNQRIDDNPVYTSPITSQCQTNHIVLLTDGEPSQNSSEDLIESKFGLTCSDPTATGIDSDGRCAEELVEKLYTTDQHASFAGSKITTHVIGFGLDPDGDEIEYLDDIANAGGSGEVYQASDTADLLDAFEKIVAEVLSFDTTFVSPGVTVNTFNRLTHRNEIYYALFKPQSTPSWEGNLKRYGINSSGVILDADGDAAIDSTTGFFLSGARSWWSSADDGNDVSNGAAAENLPNSSTRNVYTYYTGSTSTTLSNTVNEFVSTNTNVTKAMLGISTETDAYRTDLINWARGYDPVNLVQRKRLADPLHSVPHLVTYGGSDASPDLTIFYGDNEGFFHAVDADTGIEDFAFIPQELLPNLDTVYTNTQADAHPYGIDGVVNAWVYDANGDNQIVEADGDHVYVYFGMRRGGKSYYALDVTDRANPKMLWHKKRGDTGYAELGQTWSKPVKTKVKIGNDVKDVLIFSGGYDTDQDSATVITADTEGRAIYIVDASTGDVLWNAGPSGATENFSDMIYSIPASVRVTDMNGDGLADQMYVGDVGGQLWRFDIENGASASQLVTGAVIADVSGTSAANSRRFYHEPDVSVIIENNKRKLAISIGSGYRAHPLSTVINDRMYMFKQEDIFDAPADGDDSGTYPDYVKIDESMLYDATQNLVQSSDADTQNTALNSLTTASGWYINLEANGEKMISTPLAVSGQLYFTTYSPEVNNANCNPSNGTSRLYSVNVLDAGAVNPSNSTGSVDKRERYEELLTVGIPADPVRLRISDNQGTNDVLCVGTECNTIGGGQNLIKTYWYTE